MQELKFGDRVSYQYTHHLNSKSTTEIEKHGTYKRTIWPVIPKRGPEKFALVRFDGNKNDSRVLKKLLKKICEN